MTNKTVKNYGQPNLTSGRALEFTGKRSQCWNRGKDVATPGSHGDGGGDLTIYIVLIES